MKRYGLTLSGTTCFLSALLIWASPGAAQTQSETQKDVTGNTIGIANTNQVGGNVNNTPIPPITSQVNGGTTTGNIANTNQVNGGTTTGNIANTNQVNGGTTTGNIANTNQVGGNVNHTTIAPITSQVNSDSATGNTATTNQTLTNANHATIVPITSQMNSDSATGNTATTNLTVKNANHATIMPDTSQMNSDSATGNTATTNLTVKNANHATVAPGVNLLFADKAVGTNNNVHSDADTATLSSHLNSDRSNKGGELRGLDRANHVHDLNQAAREIHSATQDLNKDVKDVRHQDAATLKPDIAAKPESAATAADMPPDIRDTKADLDDLRTATVEKPERGHRR